MFQTFDQAGPVSRKVLGQGLVRRFDGLADQVAGLVAAIQQQAQQGFIQGQFLVAQSPHDRFGDMRERDHVVITDNAGGSLDRMHGTKQFVDQLFAVRFVLEFQQHRFEILEQFPRFLVEDLSNLGQKCIVVHSEDLVFCAPVELLPELQQVHRVSDRRRGGVQGQALVLDACGMLQCQQKLDSAAIDFLDRGEVDLEIAVICK